MEVSLDQRFHCIEVSPDQRYHCIEVPADEKGFTVYRRCPKLYGEMS